jgi:hypothetical protein
MLVLLLVQIWQVDIAAVIAAEDELMGSQEHASAKLTDLF